MRSVCSGQVYSFATSIFEVAEPIFLMKEKLLQIYRDFSKAFDKVYHEKLFHKLNGYGIFGSLLMIMMMNPGFSCDVVSVNRDGWTYPIDL